MTEPNFRSYVPKPGESRISVDTPEGHTEERFTTERVRELFAEWDALYEPPFTGITTDGTVVPGLFDIRSEGAPTRAIFDATAALLGQLSPAQKDAMCFEADAHELRKWQNSELYVEKYGLRLDKVPPATRETVMAILRASFSAQGYEKSRNVMRLNAFLGELVEGPNVLSEWAYTFCLFGKPSADEPWGWQLFGHHLILHCFIMGGQMVLSPAFWGAEPCYADAGPFAGIRLFEDEERAGLELMRSLSADQQARAIVAHSMVGGDLPDGRRHFADNLHLGGARQDNRIVPYEGIAGVDLTDHQRRNLVDLVAAYLAPLPECPMQARAEQIERHMAETHFCWIGGFEEDSPFYYRIQSPVVMIEFDQHIGLFLTNTEPAKFHVHTIVRTPNGNDYGLDLLRQHYENSPHHRHDHGAPGR